MTEQVLSFVAAVVSIAVWLAAFALSRARAEGRRAPRWVEWVMWPGAVLALLTVAAAVWLRGGQWRYLGAFFALLAGLVAGVGARRLRNRPAPAAARRPSSRPSGASGSGPSRPRRRPSGGGGRPGGGGGRPSRGGGGPRSRGGRRRW